MTSQYLEVEAEELDELERALAAADMIRQHGSAVVHALQVKPLDGVINLCEDQTSSMERTVVVHMVGVIPDIMMYCTNVSTVWPINSLPTMHSLLLQIV